MPNQNHCLEAYDPTYIVWIFVKILQPCFCSHRYNNKRSAFMYVAFEGTNELLKNKLFAQCLEFYKNRNESVDVFHPLAPMPSYVWWEQVFLKFSNNKVFTSDLLVRGGSGNLNNTYK